MSVLFLCDQKFRIANAFTKEQINGRPVMSFAEFKANPVRGVEIIFSTWGMPSLTEEEIAEYFPSLKAVFYAAGSVQHFARPFLLRGVRVFSAWAANGVPVAEFAVAQIILANKGYFMLDSLYKKRGFTAANDFAENFCGNYFSTVGILGAGAIGSLVIKMLSGYDLRIKVCDSFLSEERAAELGAQKTGLMEIFESCDVISNHIANNERTKGMLTYELFSAMKPYAAFINTGRGAQIDGDALLRAMREVPTRTALLDVTDPEEPLPSDSPYLKCDNIFLTPHRAGSMGKEVLRMGSWMFAEYERYLAGSPAKYEVTSDMLETMA